MSRHGTGAPEVDVLSGDLDKPIERAPAPPAPRAPSCARARPRGLRLQHRIQEGSGRLPRRMCAVQPAFAFLFCAASQASRTAQRGVSLAFGHVPGRYTDKNGTHVDTTVTARQLCARGASHRPVSRCPAATQLHYPNYIPNAAAAGTNPWLAVAEPI